MMNKLKKGIALLSALLALASAVAVQPVGAVARNEKDPETREVILPWYGGNKPGRVESTTTAVQVVSGSGLLYWLCASGTAAVPGKAVMAFDTSDSTTIGSFAVTARAISPLVIATANSSGVQGNNVGCWFPPGGPIRFENGLVLKADSATLNGIAGYRLDSGVNP